MTEALPGVRLVAVWATGHVFLTWKIDSLGAVLFADDLNMPLLHPDQQDSPPFRIVPAGRADCSGAQLAGVGVTNAYHRASLLDGFFSQLVYIAFGDALVSIF